MNEALVLYKDEEKVCSISGYVYPVKVNEHRTFFIKGADAWGWATWSRAWKNFEKNPNVLLKKIRQLGNEYDFNFYGSFESDIMATIYEMKYKINLNFTEFQNTTNPTWKQGTKSYITEIALLDEDKDILVMSKLQSPVLRQGIQQYLVKIDF